MPVRTDNRSERIKSIFHCYLIKPNYLYILTFIREYPLNILDNQVYRTNSRLKTLNNQILAYITNYLNFYATILERGEGTCRKQYAKTIVCGEACNARGCGRRIEYGNKSQIPVHMSGSAI